MDTNGDIELARRLIRMPSSPGSGGQRQVAEVLADRLDGIGFDVTVDAYADGHANVVARWGRPDQPAICMSGHLDTVTVVENDWTVDPFGAEIRDGRLYGRGAVDMKTGVAALVTAAEEYVSTSTREASPIALVLTAEEEVGSLGAAALTREPGLLSESRFLLIAEPTSNQPVLGHRGAVWLDVVARGRSCHGSTPELGDNAVEKLMDALQAIRNWTTEHEASHEVLGRRTLNIGQVHGGVLRNVVPDSAAAQLDFRTPLPEDAVELGRILGEVVQPYADITPVLSLPPVYTPPNDPWVALVLEVAAKRVDLVGAPGVAKFFTDASVLTGALGNAPTVICGPGSPDQAHVVDEWCAVEQVPAATALYVDLLHLAARRDKDATETHPSETEG